MSNPTAENTVTIPRFNTGDHPGDILRAGLAVAGGPVALACSFSVEDVVIIDLLQEIAPETRIFALDTGRLNEETYETAEAISARYGISIDWYFPEREAVEKLEREKGLFSFRNSLENRLECCRIRKVEPLQRALKELGGWITGMRRGQSATRGEIEPLEVDTAHGGIIKINPLAFWSAEKVWAYARQRRFPVNRLHRQGYPSIGCAPCTRAIEPGEDERAGRWWWESPGHKECGLHRP
ncbi:MAG: phosphoadenylyl-sulfate reductase [Thermodesulfobacteriota bacterium]|jgi:phosphoadenosine phosphosulfate reductase|nr:phosphoadenylyl-sulfate reductase [Thermodesulfobacteriota bacterium]